MNANELKRCIPGIEVVARDLYGIRFQNGTGRCPFGDRHHHDDRHPSLRLDRKKERIFCASQECFGRSGADVFALVQRMDGSTFQAAMSRLASHYGIDGLNAGPGASTSDKPVLAEVVRSALAGKGFRVAAEFYYTENVRNVRFEKSGSLQPAKGRPEKTFRWEHRSGGQWWSGAGNEPRPLYTNAMFRERDQVGTALGFEGEGKSDLAGDLGFPAFNYHGLKPEQCGPLAGIDVVLMGDKDVAGHESVRVAGNVIAASKQARSIRWIDPPEDLPPQGDIRDGVEKFGWKREDILGLIETAREFTLDPCRAGSDPEKASPWAAAQSAPEFVKSQQREPELLEPPFLALGAVTELFSPRGIGKTVVAHRLGVKLAKQGLRVLLLDRDNPPGETRRRLRAWGAGENDVATLKVMTREQIPPLTNRLEWAAFPVREYDLVIIDSLDATAEGVGEKDSGKPSLAIAPLLDIARSTNGPAILVLGNTVKSGEHGRGNGVIEDRADICFEVRDATELKPSGKNPWWEELPPGNAGSWAQRATRRKQRDHYRLAFVPSKFRVGEEPEPLILEIDLSGERWTLRDVTAEVKERAVQALETAEAEGKNRTENALRDLQAEVERQASSGSPMKKEEAEDFLRERDLTRKHARQLVAENTGSRWRVEERKGPGRPKILLPIDGTRDRHFWTAETNSPP